MIEKLLQI